MISREFSKLSEDLQSKSCYSSLVWSKPSLLLNITPLILSSYGRQSQCSMAPFGSAQCSHYANDMVSPTTDPWVVEPFGIFEICPNHFLAILMVFIAIFWDFLLIEWRPCFVFLETICSKQIFITSTTTVETSLLFQQN